MATSGGNGVSIRISAIDNVSAPLAKIGRELQQLSGSVRAFEKEGAGTGPRGGFFDRARDFAVRGTRDIGIGLRAVGKEARNTGKQFLDAFAPLTGLRLGGLLGGAGIAVGAAAAVAGLTDVVSKSATAGAQLGRDAARIGIGTKALQEFEAAAQIAGAPVGAMTTGLENLNKVMHDTVLGLNSEASGAFKKLGIDVGDVTRGVRPLREVLPELVESLSKIPDPIERSRVATIFFGEAIAHELFPVLSGGREELAKNIELHRKYGHDLSDQGVKDVKEFEESQKLLTDAFVGFGNALVNGGILQQLTPIVTGMAGWVAANRDWLTQKIHDGIEDVGDVLKSVPWKDIGKDIHNIGVEMKTAFDYVKNNQDVLGALIGGYAGAQLGATFGPLGAAIGAGVGAVGGAYTGARNQNRPIGPAPMGEANIPPAPGQPQPPPIVPGVEPGAPPPLLGGRNKPRPGPTYVAPIPPATASPAPSGGQPPPTVPLRPDIGSDIGQSGKSVLPDWIPRNSRGEAYSPDLDAGAGKIDPEVMRGFREGRGFERAKPGEGAPPGKRSDLDLDFLKTRTSELDTRHSVDIDIASAQSMAVKPTGEGPAQHPLRTQFAFATI